MNYLEITGIIAHAVGGLWFIKQVLNNLIPKRNTWFDCLNDHDRMIRDGLRRCDRCASTLDT